MKTLLLFLASLPLVAQTTAVFPQSAATYNQVYLAADNAQTTLSAPIDNVTLTVPVGSTAGFLTPTLLTIDSEELAACSMTSTSFTICAGGRGAGSTAATSHLAASKVAVRVAAAFHNNLAAEVLAIEKKLADEYPSPKDKLCTGDNVHDDTACFNAALAAAIANGRPLYCPGGTYKITGPLVATLSGTAAVPSNWALRGDGTCILESWNSDGSGVLEIKTAAGVPYAYDATMVSGIVFRRHQGAGATGNPAFALKLDALVGARVHDCKFLSDPYHPELAFTYGLWLNGMQQGEVSGNYFIANQTNVYQAAAVGTGFDGNSGPSDFHGNSIFNGNTCYLVSGSDAWITDDHLGACGIGIHNSGGNVLVHGVHFEQHATAGFLQDGSPGRATITGSSFYDPSPSKEISIQTGDALIIGNPVISGPVVFAAGTCFNGTHAEPGCIFTYNTYGTVPVDNSGRLFEMGNIWSGAAGSITTPVAFGQPLTVNNPGVSGAAPIALLNLQANVNFAQDAIAKLSATGANGAGVSAVTMNGNNGMCVDTNAFAINFGTGLGQTAGSCGTKWAQILANWTTLPRIVSTGSTPSCSLGTGGGGAGALCAVSGTDTVGTVSITVGAAPTGTPVATLTSPVIFPSLYHMVISPANAATAALGANAAYVSGNTANAVTLSTAAVLTAGTTYSWQYYASGR